MRTILSSGLLSAAIVFGFAANANAQGAEVQRSGQTFYKAACAQAVGLAAHCHAKIVTDAAGHPLVKANPDVSGYSPANLRDAYKITGTGSSSTIIAIVDAYGYTNAETDLGVYRSNFGLPACTTANGCFKKLNQNGQQGNYPAQNIGWAQESALDLDMASAMCSKLQDLSDRSKNQLLSNLATAVNTAANLGAHAISNSYGGGESGTHEL